VIGWAVSDRMKHDLAIRALKLAVNLRQPPPDCIHHTDRGSQYRSHDYQKILRRQGFKVSMSGKGNCYDNSAVATFFKTLKAELIWRHRRETRRQAEIAFGTCREPMATDALRLKFQVQHLKPAGHRMLRWTDETSTSTVRNVA
jgi:transposase InsO family protein